VIDLRVGTGLEDPGEMREMAGGCVRSKERRIAGIDTDQDDGSRGAHRGVTRLRSWLAVASSTACSTWSMTVFHV